MRVSAGEIRSGSLVVLDGELWRVLEARPVTASGRNGFVEAGLHRLRDSSKATRRFRTTDRVDLAPVDTRDLHYLYAEGGLHHFMDPESFEQWAVDAELLGDDLAFMRENDVLAMEMVEGRPVGALLPRTVDLVVTGTAPGIEPGTGPDVGSGEDAIVNVFKDAMLETGITIRVPMFVEMGERVRVDTQTGQFVDRIA